MDYYQRRYELLALTLGLKRNTNLYYRMEDAVKEHKRDGDTGTEDEVMLLSTYKKMIEQDTDGFFIDENRKEHILSSLTKTLDFCNAPSTTASLQILESLKTNDPTSFLIVPLAYPLYSGKGHCSGLIIYKHGNCYDVVMVDKAKLFNHQFPVGLVTIYAERIDQLNHVLYLSNKFALPTIQPFEELKKLVHISTKKCVSRLNVDMSPQNVGNCIVNEVESTLKVALFNCQKSILSYSHSKTTLRPKWNSCPHSTLEMRKRFLKALKTNKHEQNKSFDYIFNNYYLKRKNHPKNVKLQQKMMKLEKIRSQRKNNIYKKIKYIVLKRRYNNIYKRNWRLYKRNKIVEEFKKDSRIVGINNEQMPPSIPQLKKMGDILTLPSQQRTEPSLQSYVVKQEKYFSRT